MFTNATPLEKREKLYEGDNLSFVPYQLTSVFYSDRSAQINSSLSLLEEIIDYQRFPQKKKIKKVPRRYRLN